MNFALDEDLIVLRDSAQRFLASEVDLAPLLVPGATVADAGTERLWSKMVELGWPALAVPEAHGGLGLSTLELAMIVGECGRVLAPSPLYGTLAGTWALIAAGSERQKAALLPRVAAGQLKLALAILGAGGDTSRADCGVRVAGPASAPRLTGSAHFVVDAPAADALIVASGDGSASRFYLVDRAAPGVAVTRVDWRDITRDVGTVVLTDTPAEPLAANPNDVWPWIRDRLYLVLATESAAGMRAVLDETVAYARERVAFGRPIGAFQAIKHQLADLLAQVECAATAVLYAAWALAADDPLAARAAAMAQSYASDAYREVTFRSIQVFGAIGFTWEMKNHLYFKRARANAELLGPPAAQREQLVRMLVAAASASPDPI